MVWVIVNVMVQLSISKIKATQNQPQQYFSIIESVWGKFKQASRSRGGTCRHLFINFVSEYLWGKKFKGPDALFFFWKHVSEVFVCVNASHRNDGQETAQTDDMFANGGGAIKHKVPKKLLSSPIAFDKENISPVIPEVEHENPEIKEVVVKEPEAVSLECTLLDSLTDSGWKDLLHQEFRKGYMTEIFVFLQKNQKNGVKVFPPRELVFNAFNSTPFANVRVVLIGQDPAWSLLFRSKGQKLPPSLKNMYKELRMTSRLQSANHGCLDGWAAQGVFMLNATLTAHKANSHSSIGWQKFTDAVIRLVSDRSERGVVFLLWADLLTKRGVGQSEKHIVIKSAHPSPLSYRLFKMSLLQPHQRGID
uniref:Uracil-DNA glycosylase-like domain-containing protein n=1 Tax=Ditylenchus dipsaci TaxID=166011 RepID=A0A915D977_9BILA